MTMSQSCFTLVENYFNAWNARDPDAVGAAFAEGGTYTDPTVTGRPLTGPALAGHARALLGGFPDLSFEMLDTQSAGDDPATVVTRWLMRGTNSGPLRGRPPTGKPVVLRGVDVITISGGKIWSVEGYFDRQTLAEQLGFQVMEQPDAIGPFRFGLAVRASSGSTKVPGAMSLTWIDSRSDAESEQIKLMAATIAGELTTEPGFLSWLGLAVAGRLYTITAWESEDAIRAVMRSSAHKDAVMRFFAGELGAAASTGVWTPHRLNALRQRCPACDAMMDRASRADGTCACGQPLPEAPERW